MQLWSSSKAVHIMLHYNIQNKLQQVRWTERLSFSQLLTLRLCCHQICGACHFLTAYFCEWVLSVAQPCGELAQPGDLTWKLTLPNWFLLDQWLSDSLCALRAGREEKVRNRWQLSMSYKRSHITILFPANTWLGNYWVNINRMNMWCFCVSPPALLFSPMVFYLLICSHDAQRYCFYLSLILIWLPR